MQLTTPPDTCVNPIKRDLFFTTGVLLQPTNLTKPHYREQTEPFMQDALMDSKTAGQSAE